METVLKFTKTELVNAFKLHNKDVIDNPNDYDEIDKSEDTAIKQVEALLAFLKTK